MAQVQRPAQPEYIVVDHSNVEKVHAQNRGALIARMAVPAAIARGIDYECFDALAVKHSERAGPPTAPTGYCEDYRCFWSLNFAISRATFEAVGGFETQVGFISFISWSGLDIGRDRSSPVSHYEAPFEFTGKLRKVTVLMDDDQALDSQKAAEAVLARE